jgi:deoxyribodipyrimidine photolyase-related protein
MERFYRSMRRHFQILVEGDSPAGGQWNFDNENRRKLPSRLQPPSDIGFEPDEITLEVAAEVAAFECGVGTVENFRYAVTREQALKVFDDFLASRLEFFGPYEDAMTVRSHSLYHRQQ